MIFLFDLDDTLYDLEDRFVISFKEMYGYIPKDMSELFLDFRKYNNEKYDDAINGRITMDELTVYRAKKSFAIHNIIIDDEEARRFQKIYLKNKKYIRLNKYIIKILKLLNEKGADIGIITNGPYEDQSKKIQYLGLNKFIEEKNIIISGKEGVHKPDKRIFHIGLSRIIKNRNKHDGNSNEETNYNKDMEANKNIYESSSNDKKVGGGHISSKGCNRKYYRKNNKDLYRKRIVNEFSMRIITSRKWIFFKKKFDKNKYKNENKNLSDKNVDIKNEIFYIGDSFENDILAGYLSGYRTIWLDHRNYENTIGIEFFDYSVRDYKALYDLIKKIV